MPSTGVSELGEGAPWSRSQTAGKGALVAEAGISGGCNEPDSTRIEKLPGHLFGSVG